MKKTLQLCFVLLVAITTTTRAHAQVNQNGQQPTLILDEDWRITNTTTGGGVWRNKDRFTYAYPTTTSVAGVQEHWDTIANVFKNMQKYTFTVNANGSLNQYIIQNWVPASSTWKNYYRVTLTYYNNDPAKTLVQLTDTATSATGWGNYYRQTNTYSTGGYKTQDLSELKSGATWLPSSRITYTNNTAGYPTQELLAYYYSGAWNNNTKTTYTYNASNQVTQKIAANWDFVSAFANDERTAYTYTTAGKVATELQDSWDGALWYKYSKINYTYNAANYMLTSKTQLWNVGTSVYQDASSEDNTLNSSNNPTVELSKKAYSVTNLLINDSRRTTQYQTVVGTEAAAAPVANAPAFKLYPNPANDQITVEMATDQPATLLLTNAQGQVISTRNINDNQTQLEIQQLPAGAYHLSVWQSGNLSTRTFVKN